MFVSSLKFCLFVFIGWMCGRNQIMICMKDMFTRTLSLFVFTYLCFSFSVFFCPHPHPSLSFCVCVFLLIYYSAHVQITELPWIWSIQLHLLPVYKILFSAACSRLPGPRAQHFSLLFQHRDTGTAVDYWVCFNWVLGIQLIPSYFHDKCFTHWGN